MDDQHLLVVGDGPVTGALQALAAVPGLASTVARTADEVAASLPSSTAVVVTSHHDGLRARGDGARQDDRSRPSEPVDVG